MESALSGAKRPIITERQRLWYRRQFAIPESWRGKKILLHFDAVDWEAKVWVNGKEIGTHRGGYDRFSFDITEALAIEEQQEIVVSVVDPTEGGSQARGKQMQHPREPFFSASSGIWQTVWLEPVSEDSIESLKLVSDIDAGVLRISVNVRGATNGVSVSATALDGNKAIGDATGIAAQELSISIPNPKLWSPDDPFLYDLKISLLRNGKTVDSVDSYFGMRKISIGKNAEGMPVILLNNKRLFQWGPLDQGYWPDGIYTAPTEEGMRYDIETIKKLGFNMCRKHVKIEPERWYHWCDKMGLLVWQDMPNGDNPASQAQKEINRKPEFAAQFETELERMIVQHANHPSVVVWVLFNQAWGQYDTARLTTLCKKADPTRLVISASGWHDMKTGDIISAHRYPVPAGIQADGTRACVVGECGALGFVVQGHLWGGIGHWNTTYFASTKSWEVAYGELISKLIAMKSEVGLSAAVVTQLTDVESELNGFVTYDRAVVKMPIEKIREMNEQLISVEPKPPARRK